MKRIKIPKQANLQEDMLKAIRIYSRNNFGFQRGTITKNKKKYNRIQNKRELRVTESSLYLFIVAMLICGMSTILIKWK